MPVTATVWRPENAATKTANVLITAQADGTLKHWHVTSGKCLHSMQEDPENHLYAVEFNQDGSILATGGRDRHVRLYDEQTKSLICAMKEKGKVCGHANRIFAVKFAKHDQNMMASGGWDHNLFLYDIRRQGPTHALYGPLVCGDALQFHSDGHSLVAGSYR
jgi:COMPASS component SWD3